MTVMKFRLRRDADILVGATQESDTGRADETGVGENDGNALV